MEQFDVAVIGQGYAGLVAARAAAERGLRTISFEAGCFGGQILNINHLDPPAPEDEICGVDLASNLWSNNSEAGVTQVIDTVTELVRGEEGDWVVRTASQANRARHVIVACGGRLRKLGVAGEEELFGQGVSECADCDGPMFMDMETVVVGSGDAAFQEALSLTEYASKVTILMRGDRPKARAEFVERAAANPKVVQLTGARVLEIAGEPGKGVENVKIDRAGQGEATLPCAGVFIFIGIEPNTAFLPSDLQRDGDGALITSPSGATNLPNVWAVGAVRVGFEGKLTSAAADVERVMAALATS